MCPHSPPWPCHWDFWAQNKEQKEWERAQRLMPAPRCVTPAPAPSLHSSHPEIPCGCRNTPPACSQDCSHVLRDTGTSPSPPPAPAFLTGKAGCVKSVLGASSDTSSSPKPMRNAQTDSAGLHTNGVRARREQRREREGARLQLLATHD